MKEWKCKDCCCFETDACPYPYVQEHYNACTRVVIQHDEAYQQGRADAIDECIKLVGGNTKTIVGIVFDNSIPIHDRALGRMAKNKLIEELVEQLEQLKEQNE